MTTETLRSKDHRAFWLVVAISLFPLVPYALKGGNQNAPAQLVMQDGAVPSTSVATTQVVPAG